jgi:acyl transferase domain-containing protein
MSDDHSHYSHNTIDGIAIISMAGRFPGAPDVDQFWRNLRDGVESVSFVTDDDLRAGGFDPALAKHSRYVRSAAVLQDADLFDATFFGINPREAQIMDPQHRIFLECAWEALESAGYDPLKYDGLVGMYAGQGISTYLLHNLMSRRDLEGAVSGMQAILANDKDYVTTRVSYKLDLKGPSFTVQTACSTSLVAVSLACQGLLSYQCDMALAGGVTASLSNRYGYLYQEGDILSPDGHCRAFDAKAQGTVWGGGLGIVVLKRLEDALADGDVVHAIIRGFAVNNDGSSKIGYTAPGVSGQAEVIAMAQAVAGIHPDTISYIEAHGTGTLLGDPVEIAGLTQAFRAKTQRKGFCAVGSLKSNVGHLDTAAGVAGLIKTVMALKNRQIPPSLHFEQPNPEIDFANSPFFVNTTLREWTSDNGHPRRAGVSAYGIGGTNAHVIVEEAPRREPSLPGRPWQLLLMSAKTGPAAVEIAKRLGKHLAANPDLNLADVAYTLQVGRQSNSQRSMLICRDVEDAVAELTTPSARLVAGVKTVGRARSVVFMFPGQGAQYLKMGFGLYQREPTFREYLDRCAEGLRPHLGFDLRSVLFESSEAHGGESNGGGRPSLQDTAITQPALFAVEYSLAQLWMEWGIRPAAMIGHSIGEYAAACIAGVFTLDEALQLVAARGRLMQQLPRGAMLAVTKPAAEIQPLLPSDISLAAVNAPNTCVVSGPFEAIDRLERDLAEKEIGGQRLNTSHAFHSAMMEPILPSFTQLVAKMRLKPPSIPFVSNLTGTWITPSEATDPAYWANHLRQAVQFSEGAQLLVAEADRIFLEVGPGRTLNTLLKQHPDQANDRVRLSSLRHPLEQQPDDSFLLNTLGRLWLAGVDVDWKGFYRHEQRHRVSLPTYPFERQRFWIDPGEGGPGRPQMMGKKPDMADWFYVTSWHRSVLPDLSSSLADAPANWLVFADTCGIAERMIERLTNAGHKVVRAVAGDHFEKVAEGAYSLNPSREQDYHALVAELYANGARLENILHVWNVTTDIAPAAELEQLETSLNFSFYSLLFLAKAIGELNLTDKLHITVLSNHVQEVIGDETVSPLKAALLGPIKVIPQEYPNITCRSIDVIRPDPRSVEEQRLFEQITEELATKKPVSAAIAYRGRHRWVRNFEPLRVLEPTDSATLLRDRGVYLITGGMGGLGLTLAEFFAEKTRARLVLVGRSAFPPREEWDALVRASENGEANPRVATIRKLQAMEAAGAEILLCRADVTNLEQMQAVVAQVHAHFGPIHGVVHAAGLPGGGVMQLKDVETAAAIMAPKVKGTLVLGKALEGDQLDFMAMCSSLAAMIGGFGQVDYCSGNAFMDVFANRQSRAGRFTLTINWDYWQEVGMAAKTAIPAHLEELRQAELLIGIHPNEGKDAFLRSLGSKLTQVIVSTQDFIARIEAVDALFKTDSTVQDSLSSVSFDSLTFHPRPNLDTPYVAPRNETETIIVDLWQRALGIEGVGVNDDFFALGGHSLLATHLAAQLRKALSVEVPMRTIFQAPTVAGLALAVIKAKAAQAGGDELAETVGLLENLTDEEAAALLAAEDQVVSGEIAKAAGKGSDG